MSQTTYGYHLSASIFVVIFDLLNVSSLHFGTLAFAG